MSWKAHYIIFTANGIKNTIDRYDDLFVYHLSMYTITSCLTQFHSRRQYFAYGRLCSSLGSESKKIILKLLDEEFSYAKIADIIGVSKSCISGFVKRYKISQHYV